MFKGLKILLIFLFLSKLSFSQEIYPKRVVLDNGDSVVCILNYQVVIINQVFEDLRFETELNDSLSSILGSYKSLVDSSSKEIKVLDSYVINLSTIVDNQQKIQDLTDQELKKGTKKQSWLKTTRIVAFGVGILIGYITGKHISLNF